ncbi:hypothetical protein [Paenibacillus sp. USHLN196]|uniref:hypothetical protein n=1 Tax=Paenibacillus sp. USHLN196 TaxID=3081291 RepID=UPI003016F330
MFEINDKNILAFITKLSEEGGLYTLRDYFPSDDTATKRFLENLDSLKSRGYIRNIEIQHNHSGTPISANWEKVKVTEAGKKHYDYVNGFR